jgi:hypothetical protein
MTTRLIDITQRLADNGQAIAAYFRALTPDQWEVTVQGEEAHWNVRQMLAHLATIERSMQALFQAMLEGGADTPSDFDLDRYNQSQVAKISGLPPEEIIQRFEQTRARTIEIVQGLSEDDLDRQGTHAFLDEGTLETFVRWAYIHADLHRREVEAALKK